MVHTVLLEEILRKANNIQTEYGFPNLCASHIAAAVIDLCMTPYTGFSLSDTTCRPSRFEEERLRYIAAKEIKLRSYFRTCLARHRREGIAEDTFDFARCEQIATLRGTDILSSDVVFLCALMALDAPYKSAVRTAFSEDAIIRILENTDGNIYDYVIREVEAICKTLLEKVNTATEVRDWKPAAKFAEPEDLKTGFLNKIRVEVADNIATVRFPRFFGTTDLKVSVHQIDGIYYVHDNGCAVKHLLKQVKDKEKCHRIVKKICHSDWIRKDSITGHFLTVSQFLYFLKLLIFIAHGDLVYTKMNQQICRKDENIPYIGPEQAQTLDGPAMVDILKNGIYFAYEENTGLYYWVNTNYSTFSTRAAFLLETLDQGKIRISDKRKGKVEGEIFEALYWDHEDITPYSRLIAKFAARFGASFDGKDIYLTDKQENYYAAICKCFNLAILLSELGGKVDLPKIRSKG
ncbi:MAG: hypothetical protein IKK11_02815 [Oscillospiraceae bacterium]|nr:hypothetical protein [Oscillospiraceae bacterium]